ncbi:MAG: hypothetical protein WBF93_07320 [Pirellulales bacterium]|nr:hypothetical protein [Pirellulales bacterium]
MLWIHPQKPWLRLRRKVVAVIAVIEMGIHDHERIASIVGLKPDEVARIDEAEDKSIRELSLEGIPHGEFFVLAREIRCPECGARLTLAPCATCQTRRIPHQFSEAEQIAMRDEEEQPEDPKDIDSAARQDQNGDAEHFDLVIYEARLQDEQAIGALQRLCLQRQPPLLLLRQASDKAIAALAARLRAIAVCAKFDISSQLALVRQIAPITRPNGRPRQAPS